MEDGGVAFIDTTYLKLWVVGSALSFVSCAVVQCTFLPHLLATYQNQGKFNFVSYLSGEVGREVW